MKLSLASLILGATVASSGVLVSASTVRGAGTDAADSPHPLSTKEDCNGLTNQQSCLSSSCFWCECAAVPSACYTQEQANSLPSGVFTCQGPSAVKEAGAGDNEANTSEATLQGTSTSSYELLPGLNFEMTDGPVDPDFCDASSPLSLSGYMNVKGSEYDKNGENKHLFFWFFEKRGSDSLSIEDKSNIPLIVWLTGGPGCSSSLALLTENGPCSVDLSGESTVVRESSWTEAGHVLWLDQPAGVGYSYGEATDKNEKMVSEDAYYFLQAFYKKHPEYAANPLFVVGESYGGHYAPAIAHKVFEENKNVADGLIEINLGGVAVGNGLTNPAEQYKWYAEMAYKNSHGIKTVSEDTYNTMTSAIPTCEALINKCNDGDSVLNSFACQSAFIVCNTAETSPYQMSGLNPYDIRKKCESPPLCYDFSNVNTFMNLDSTREALHVSDKAGEWESCNMGINMKFHSDWMHDFSPYIGDMLNGGIPVLIYAGDVDFICNYLGNRAWTLGLDWDHTEEFNKAEDHEWADKSGLARTSNGFTFLQVYDAGHMVPSDQPEVALKMITNFVNGGEF